MRTVARNWLIVYLQNVSLNSYSQNQFRVGDFNFLSDSLKIILLILGLPMFKYNYYSFTPLINSA